MERDKAKSLAKLIGCDVKVFDSAENPVLQGVLRYTPLGNELSAGYYVDGAPIDMDKVHIITPLQSGNRGIIFLKNERKILEAPA